MGGAKIVRVTVYLQIAFLRPFGPFLLFFRFVGGVRGKEVLYRISYTVLSYYKNGQIIGGIVGRIRVLHAGFLPLGEALLPSLLPVSFAPCYQYSPEANGRA